MSFLNISTKQAWVIDIAFSAWGLAMLRAVILSSNGWTNTWKMSTSWSVAQPNMLPAWRRRIGNKLFYLWSITTNVLYHFIMEFTLRNLRNSDYLCLLFISSPVNKKIVDSAATDEEPPLGSTEERNKSKSLMHVISIQRNPICVGFIANKTTKL